MVLFGRKRRKGKRKGEEEKQNRGKKIECCELTATLVRKNESLVLSGADSFIIPSTNTHENFTCLYLKLLLCPLKCLYKAWLGS